MQSLVAVRRIGVALLAAGTALLVSSGASAQPPLGAAGHAQTVRAASWKAPAPRSPNAPVILHVASPRAGKRTVVVGGRMSSAKGDSRGG